MASSFIMLYPQQIERGIKMDDVQYTDGRFVEALSGKVAVARAKNVWKNIFKKK
jgi:hypothetical protein